jgi:hypothetical protein
MVVHAAAFTIIMLSAALQLTEARTRYARQFVLGLEVVGMALPCSFLQSFAIVLVTRASGNLPDNRQSREIRQKMQRFRLGAINDLTLALVAIVGMAGLYLNIDYSCLGCSIIITAHAMATIVGMILPKSGKKKSKKNAVNPQQSNLENEKLQVG